MAVISTIVSVFIFAPILLFGIVFFIWRILTKNVKQAIRKSADISTIFFIFSVHFIVLTLWDTSLLVLLLLLLLLLFLLFGWIYWKINRELNYRKIFRGFWRFNFLFFVLFYLAFMLIGIVSSAFSFMAS